LSDFLDDIIAIYRLMLILLQQDNTIAPPGASGLVQSSIVTTLFPEDRVHIYDSIFLNNMYNLPDVQVSLASLAVPMPLGVVCLAVLSPSLLLLFSFWDPP
jgi:hypothetical protein